ncbi:unnamed protein product [Mucor fragilis]
MALFDSTEYHDWAQVKVLAEHFLYLISVLPTAFPPSYQEELPRPILLFNQQQFLKDVNLG